jgi:hypothetical protein
MLLLLATFGVFLNQDVKYVAEKYNLVVAATAVEAYKVVPLPTTKDVASTLVLVSPPANTDGLPGIVVYGSPAHNTPPEETATEVDPTISPIIVT